MSFNIGVNGVSNGPSKNVKRTLIKYNIQQSFTIDILDYKIQKNENADSGYSLAKSI